MGVFLPPIDKVSLRFLRAIVLGKKKSFPRSNGLDILGNPQPGNPEFTVERLYPRIKNDKKFRPYLPIETMDRGIYPPWNWVWSIVGWKDVNFFACYMMQYGIHDFM